MENGQSELLKNHEASILEIEIYRGGRRVDLREVLKNREGSEKPMTWVYTGGVFTKDNRFAGDYELSYIGIWPDRSALINLFSTLKNPYRGDFGIEMNKENKALQIDQDYEIVIRRVKQ